ncbi:MAG: hypothetical protein AMS18_01285 [Gemmatimonas sp. SG8_17]|nr:MAG: hypothetical protein AMS18_01285 [Gemmatimonas sp. SG8_17]
MRPRFSKTEVAGLTWFTLLFALAIGISNGEINQAVYLLDGLRIADPGFLEGDWYVQEVSHIHRFYSAIVALIALSGLLEVGLGFVALMQPAVLAVATYLGMKALYDRPLLPWAIAMMLFATLGTRGLGLGYLLVPNFEASSFAGTAAVVGFAFIAWSRPLGAGVAWGLAALMHGHYAVLLTPIVAGTVVVCLLRRSPVPVTRLAIPFLLLALPNLLLALRYAFAPGGVESANINLIVYPFHHLPWTEGKEPFARFGAALLLGAGGLVLAKPRVRLLLGAPIVLLAFFVLGSLAVARSTGLGIVIQIWPWRLSALLILFGFVSGGAALVAQTRPWGRWEAAAGFSSILLGAAILTRYMYAELAVASLAAWVIPLALSTSEELTARYPRGRVLLGAIPFAVVTLGFLPSLHIGLSKTHMDLRPHDSRREALYEWARTQTARQSTFAVPVEWDDFRLIARRPVLVDWKGIPGYPPDRLEWKERILTITGRRVLPTGNEAIDSYASLDCERARRLRNQYDVRYIIMKRDARLGCGSVAFEDSWYIALDMQEPQ